MCPGPRCDQCEENYYGNPTEVNGRCEQCECSGNIDHGTPDSCDPATGECLKCLHNTEGFYCEQCQLGYYGDALTQNCIQCICNKLGTNRTVGLNACDRETGQCPCLPNVLGIRCDQCAENHWKIASGTGCEACDCDPYGSLNPQCHEVTIIKIYKSVKVMFKSYILS
jgi:laminin beta 1